MLDDGWFGARRHDRAGLGDWTVSTDVWPHGLHPLVDKVTDLGMEFGLWFEPEMINLDSVTAREHPEWIMATGDRLPVESRHQQVINLGIPSACGWRGRRRPLGCRTCLSRRDGCQYAPDHAILYRVAALD